MKGKLEFTLPEEQEEFNLAVSAGRMHTCLWEISQEVFRPARKHGYPDEKIQTLLTELGEKGEELVGLLEAKFCGILNDNGVEL